MTVSDKIAEMGLDDDVIIFSNPSYDDAFVGITTNGQAVYDFDRMVEWLMVHEDMSEEEATDFICFNDSFSCGRDYPIIVYSSI